jgi:L-iditol 2-dehydrogenase
MKAARLFNPGDLRVEDIPIPNIQAHEVLVKVRAVGVCGSDIPRVMKKGAYSMPLTIGHEFSGEIAEVGQCVTEWSVGEKVTAAPLIPCRKCYWCILGKFHLCDSYSYLGSRCDGALAEYVVVQPFTLVRVPALLQWEEAAMTDPAATALHALERKNLTVDDRVAIFGIGPIGFMALEWVRSMGIRQVIAVDIFDEKLELARQLGATTTINALNTDPVQRVYEATEGLGATMVIEGAGLQKTQVQAIQSTAKQGTAVFLGISHDNLYLPKKVVDEIMRKEIIVTGTWNSNSKPFPGHEWTSSIEGMTKGSLCTLPIISHRFQINDAPQVFRRLVERDFMFNKVMFFP